MLRAKAVTDSAHGLQALGAELLSQVAHVDVDHVRARVVSVAPDVGEELVATYRRGP